MNRVDPPEEEEEAAPSQSDECNPLETCTGQEQEPHSNSEPELPSASSVTDASSLSRRRLAANKPILDRHLPLPPTPRFDDLKRMDSLSSPAITSSVSDTPPTIRRNKTSVAKLKIGDTLSAGADVLRDGVARGADAEDERVRAELHGAQVDGECDGGPSVGDGAVVFVQQLGELAGVDELLADDARVARAVRQAVALSRRQQTACAM